MRLLAAVLAVGSTPGERAAMRSRSAPPSTAAPTCASLIAPRTRRTATSAAANASVLNLDEIDQSFRPRSPKLTGRSGIVGTPQYSHQVLRATRRSNALGARD